MFTILLSLAVASEKPIPKQATKPLTLDDFSGDAINAWHNHVQENSSNATDTVPHSLGEKRKVENLIKAVTSLDENARMVDFLKATMAPRPVPEKAVDKARALKKIRQTVAMMLGLDKVISPTVAKLLKAEKKMPEGEEKQQTGSLLHHLLALDSLSSTVRNGLVELDKAKHSSKEEKDAALHTFLMSLDDAAHTLKDHIEAMKELKKPKSEPLSHLFGGDKLRAMMQKMKANLLEEASDPEFSKSKDLQDKAKLDLAMFKLVQKASADVDSLFTTAFSAYRKKPTKAVEMAVSVVLKKHLTEITDKLKKDMNGIAEVSAVVGAHHAKRRKASAGKAEESKNEGQSKEHAPLESDPASDLDQLAPGWEPPKLEQHSAKLEQDAKLEEPPKLEENPEPPKVEQPRAEVAGQEPTHMAAENAEADALAANIRSLTSM